MEEKKTGFMEELEENLMLIPLTIAVVLSLVTFVCQKFISPELKGTLLNASYYAYAYLAALALALCARNKSHMRVSLFDKVYPAPVLTILNGLSEVVGCVVMIVLLYFSFHMLSGALASGAMNEKVPALPLWPAYLAPCAGLVIALVRTAIRLIKGGKKA